MSQAQIEVWDWKEKAAESVAGLPPGERIRTILGRTAHLNKALRYQKAILAFLNDYAQVKPNGWNKVKNQIVADRENHHYQLLRVGWHGGEHIHQTVFHFDLVGDRVVIQENRTDVPIVDELGVLGIPRKDILMAFQGEEVLA